MFDIIVVAFILGYLMLIWLRTNAFAEYLTVFGLGKLFHTGEFIKMHGEGYDGNYTDFLHEYYKDDFLVRLLTCPVCVSFWLGMFAPLALNTPLAFACAPISLFFYLVFNKLL